MCLISVSGVCAHVLVMKSWSWKCFLLFNGSCRRFCKTQAGYCLYLKWTVKMRNAQEGKTRLHLISFSPPPPFPLLMKKQSQTHWCIVFMVQLKSRIYKLMDSSRCLSAFSTSFPPQRVPLCGREPLVVAVTLAANSIRVGSWAAFVVRRMSPILLFTWPFFFF